MFPRLKRRIAGLFEYSKTIAVARLTGLASAALAIHDFLVPIVERTDTSALTSKVPAWVWPVILIAFAAVMELCRHVTHQPLCDKR